MVYISRSGCTGGRAGAGFIGEQTAFYPVHDHCTDGTAGNLSQAEGFGEDAFKNSGKQKDIFEDRDQCDCEEAACHDGDDHIQNLYRCISSQNDDGGNGSQKDGCHQRRDAEGIFHGGGHGVADDLTDTAPTDQTGQGKQYCHDGIPHFLGLFSSFSCGEYVDISCGAAAKAAIQGVFFLIDLRQCCFHISGGGAGQSGYPHPENSTCTAHGNGGDHTGQIAHADTGRSGNDQSLQAGKAVFVVACLFFQCHTQHFREQANLQETAADSEIDAGRHQNQNQ